MWGSRKTSCDGVHQQEVKVLLIIVLTDLANLWQASSHQPSQRQCVSCRRCCEASSSAVTPSWPTKTSKSTSHPSGAGQRACHLPEVSKFNIVFKTGALLLLSFRHFQGLKPILIKVRCGWTIRSQYDSLWCCLLIKIVANVEKIWWLFLITDFNRLGWKKYLIIFSCLRQSDQSNKTFHDLGTLLHLLLRWKLQSHKRWWRNA